jgi:hypothetical protein
MKFRNPDHATRAIIEAAKTKLKHAANVARGKSAFWYLLGGGVGGGALLAGAGILCGGYSYIVGNKVLARQVTEGVKGVLDKAVITAKLADGGEVALAKGAQVSLDQSSAFLRVIGQAPDMPRAQPEQVRQDERPAVGKADVITNFTVFKKVTFGAGWVQTAWQYEDGNQRPSNQYCGYSQVTGNGVAQTNVDIGINGHIALPNPSPFPAVDLAAAYTQCVWWAIDPAQAVAPVAPVQTIQIHAAKR